MNLNESHLCKSFPRLMASFFIGVDLERVLRWKLKVNTADAGQSTKRTHNELLVLWQFILLITETISSPLKQVI